MSGLMIFEEKQVRRVWNEQDKKWYFSIQDIIEILTESSDIKQYVKRLKSRDPELNSNWGTICTLVEMMAADGKKRKIQAANTEGIFRIIQSIPSPKAEPFKRWLAKVGYERVQEIENPELATKRTRMLYKLKGYPEDWIEKRMRGIAIREELTDEWQKRGATEQRDFEILTAEISKATFGITPSQYKKLKGLKRQNLRDHMDDFELIFTMLGERSTTEIHKTEDSDGIKKLKDDARRGGKVAGNARKELEKELGRPIVSNKNYLSSKNIKKLK